jgi:hypothetical protein
MGRFARWILPNAVQRSLSRRRTRTWRPNQGRQVLLDHHRHLAEVGHVVRYPLVGSVDQMSLRDQPTSFCFSITSRGRPASSASMRIEKLLPRRVTVSVAAWDLLMRASTSRMPKLSAAFSASASTPIRSGSSSRTAALWVCQRPGSRVLTEPRPTSDRTGRSFLVASLGEHLRPRVQRCVPSTCSR